MSIEPAILATGLSHSFGQGALARRVLFDLDLRVEAGEFVLLMGPSGCGKTTVLTLAGGLRATQSGSMRTLGTELNGADEPTRIAIRRRIGFVFQAHNLHASLTAIENVRMGLEVHGPAALVDWRARCAAILSEVGLGAHLDKVPARLSGGEKQRVAIARALVARPPLILADEPTAALDRSNGRQVVDHLTRLARQHGSAILMVTHDNRILDAGDRVIEMEDGRIRGSLAALRP